MNFSKKTKNCTTILTAYFASKIQILDSLNFYEKQLRKPTNCLNIGYSGCPSFRGVVRKKKGFIEPKNGNKKHTLQKFCLG
jgi:hypothetical protein